MESDYRESLIERLKNEVLNVTFVKVDGNTRVLKCTLMESHLPQKEAANTGVPRKANANTISVFDLENNGWRSFRVDSIVEVK